MKKCIVFLMTAILAITTVPTPIWANENCENSIAITENAEKDIQDTVTDPRLNYIYVEQPYLESPDTQKIAVSWGDGTENITEMSAVVSGPEGEEIWHASEETDTIYLFERAYTEQEKGIYQITELNLAIQGVTYTYSLAELGAETVFGVDEEYEGIEQLSLVDDEGMSTDIAAYNIDEAGNVTEKESLEEAINQATAEIPAMMCDDGVQTRNTNLVVALDPGHDSSHAGASANGVREEVLTLKIAQYCKAELENYAGVSVYMTRTSAACPHPGGSSAKDIEQRVADAAKAGASIYVSIHLNSSKSSSAKGAEVIYPNSSWKPQVGADGKRLAELIEDELVGIGLERRAIYSKNTTIGETYEDGSISDYFTVQISAKEHGIPGIIVEHAFVTNSSDVNNYLNNEAGLKKLGVADATGIAKYFGLEKEGWQKDSKGWWYQSGSGYLKNQWALINGNWYYFDSDGYMRTDWQKIKGSWYYLGDANDGAMKTGWQKIKGSWYYLGDANDGAMKTDWKYINGFWYNFGKAGDGSMKTGWYKLNENWYYLGGSEDGRMQTDWKKIDNSWYYLGGTDDGYMRTGWQKLGGVWYYLGDANDGAMKTGWQKISGSWYYLGGANDGAMKTGWEYISGFWYNFGKAGDGSMKTGWYKPNENWYYLGGSEDGRMQTDWKKIDNSWYYLGGTDDGYMRTGWQKLGDVWYYLGDRNDGSMKTGWYVIDGKKYYFDQSSGIMQTGWKQIEGARYYFDDNGVYDASKKYTDITDNNSTTNNGVNSSTKKDEENIESKVVEGTYLIEGTTSVSVKQMTDFFRQSKYSYPTDIMKKGGASTLEEFCQIYYEEAEKEGIKAEVAFAQAMKETGWLQFKGDVKAEQYNFAGMGATGNRVTGESFKDVREGVRAQIQHLKAYGSTKNLNQTCVDNRFKYVERGCSIYVEWLGIPNNPKNKGWAAADGYGVDIVKMVQKMKSL
ncbi:N-acetylmuramoyl-L-alanine amidase [Ruminococcus sp. TF10-12AC]|nr:N-acetylmuramoyl-L-alanine amidase [Ruminococcus sp. TF10-12AC]RGI39243.1 N-acetylmuramoyl-L-alanine amidase [Ruminococcus sp. OM07-7]